MLNFECNPAENSTAYLFVLLYFSDDTVTGRRGWHGITHFSRALTENRDDKPLHTVGNLFSRKLPFYESTKSYMHSNIRRRRRNGGILRLSVTDNINALRDRLYQEIRRRANEARKKVQNQLQNVG